MCFVWRRGGRRRIDDLTILQSLLASGLVGAALELADSFLHLFARFEGDHKLFGDKDFFAGARVTRLAGSSSLHFEDAEIPQLNAMIFNQRLDDGVERFLDDFFGLQLREANLFGDGLHDFFLGHDEFPCDKARGPFRRTTTVLVKGVHSLQV
jgi:hypothetical protein